MSADEVTSLARSLERLAVDLLHALRDGVLSAVVRAAADLTRPDDDTRAQRVKAARDVRVAARRALMQARPRG